MTTPRTPYGTLRSTYWDDDTGYQLQRAGPYPLLLATWLRSNRYANMIGLYELTEAQVARALFVIPRDQIGPCFDVLRRLDDADFDAADGWVWVKPMVAERFNPRDPSKPLDWDTAGERVNNQWFGAVKIYKNLPANPFLGQFYDRYAKSMRLPYRRPGTGELRGEPREPRQRETLIEGLTQGLPQALTQALGEGLPKPLGEPLPTAVDQRSGTSDQRSDDQACGNVDAELRAHDSHTHFPDAPAKNQKPKPSTLPTLGPMRAIDGRKQKGAR